jgi:hypothetical protein
VISKIEKIKAMNRRFSNFDLLFILNNSKEVATAKISISILNKLFITGK